VWGGGGGERGKGGASAIKILPIEKTTRSFSVPNPAQLDGWFLERGSPVAKGWSC